MLLPMLKYDLEGGGQRSSEIEFTAHHYSTKQCYALEALAEILKVREERLEHAIAEVKRFNIIIIAYSDYSNTKK